MAEQIKASVNKKFVNNITLATLAIVAGLLVFLAVKFTQTTQPRSDSENKFGVTISTDKTEYSKGEIIKIVVNNNLDKPIYYSVDGDRFWGVEYFKDNRWINLDREHGWGFQLTEKNIGSTCHIVLYERRTPIELKPQTNISYQWNQRICPFGTVGPSETRIVRYFESGQYRLVFHYGSGTSTNDPYQLSDVQTVYSNIFAIK